MSRDSHLFDSVVGALQQSLSSLGNSALFDST